MAVTLLQIFFISTSIIVNMPFFGVDSLQSSQSIQMPKFPKGSIHVIIVDRCNQSAI